MRARPNASGEQLVQEYLTRVAQAARLLPKGARMAFVGRTKALVEREVGPPGARTDPQHVIEVLTRLGKPEDLVAAERTRIESGWARSGAGSLGVSDASPDVSPGELDHDRRAFTRKVVDCLSDRRIAVYFNRNLVSHHDVTDELVNGTAFSQALQTTSYEAFTEIRAQLNETARYNSEVLDGDAINARTMTAFICPLVAVVIWIVGTVVTDIVTSGIILVSAISGAVAIRLLCLALRAGEQRLRRLALSFLTWTVTLCAIIFLVIVTGLYWEELILLPVFTLALITGYILASRRTFDQCTSLTRVVLNQINIRFSLERDVSRSEQAWLDYCVEAIIIPQAVLTINTILGEDKDRLLVEQDSEGLRRLQDPTYTVPTFSESRIASMLAQMDGGSIALAGPRGAGKSTLLRKFSDPLRTENDWRRSGISVYLTAPAEYFPRDFIAELFQRLCESYLIYEGCPLPESIYRERPQYSLKRMLLKFLAILWLCLRAAAAIALIVWVVRSYVKIGYHHIYVSIPTTLRHWYDHNSRSIYMYFRKHFKRHWILVQIAVAVGVVLLAFRFFPGPTEWTTHVRPRREPPLAKRAREYLLRLQVDKTVTWGTNLNSPTLRGVNFSVNRGGEAKYIPWTFPELVGHTRRFMQDITEQFKRSSHPVIVGIDEIDRIGSIDHAEKFVSEIKAVFGVEKCFFLVAVAEDVGSIFAQRATAGRSILENAFDNIVIIEPLTFQETHDLLLKRVPGFTDSFAYLVHSLSGGLPRELIRVTRRLVEINGRLTGAGRLPRLENLAFALVRDELIEAIRATRNQMSRLTLHANWTIFFEELRSASTSLGYSSPFSMQQPYGVIKRLSELKAPESPKEEKARRAFMARDEDNARRIAGDFTAFAYFGLTVVDAFSDRYFDLQFVQEATAVGSAGSYEELALSRTELAVSPENSRDMLRRFRDSLLSHGQTKNDDAQPMAQP